jgi:hypothetical protein
MYNHLIHAGKTLIKFNTYSLLKKTQAVSLEIEDVIVFT